MPVSGYEIADETLALDFIDDLALGDQDLRHGGSLFSPRVKIAQRPTKSILELLDRVENVRREIFVCAPHRASRMALAGPAGFFATLIQRKPT